MGRKCQHKHPRTKRMNLRDDASFEWYVECAKCGETMWDECYGERGGYG